LPLAPLLPVRSANNVPRPSPIGAGEAETRSEAQSPEWKSIKQTIKGAKNRTLHGYMAGTKALRHEGADFIL